MICDLCQRETEKFIQVQDGRCFCRAAKSCLYHARRRLGISHWRALGKEQKK